jgi:thiol-disulfide isomerase/thioredoxin
MDLTRCATVTIALTAALLAGPVLADPAPTPKAAPALTPATASEILQAVRSAGGKAVLVNVWATWCPPCREEMPDLLRLRRDYAERGVRLILVSADFTSEADQAAAFLGELGVDFPTYLKKGSDMEFIDGIDPQWSGALPATFIFTDGKLRHSIYGVAAYDQFEEKLRNALR